jgi:hypothetical protein
MEKLYIYNIFITMRLMRDIEYSYVSIWLLFSYISSLPVPNYRCNEDNPEVLISYCCWLFGTQHSYRDDTNALI